MIRERISTRGVVRALEPEADLTAFRLPRELVCDISELALRRYVDGAARLWGGVTLPRLRSRGAYRAVLAERLALAVAHGADIALVKGRIDTSAPILARAGFRVPMYGALRFAGAGTQGADRARRSLWEGVLGRPEDEV